MSPPRGSGCPQPSDLSSVASTAGLTTAAAGCLGVKNFDKHAVKDFYGWNLVDYRGALQARLQTFDMTSTWITQVSNEIDEMPLPHQADGFLERETEGRARGSWSWRNIEESNL